MQMDHVLLIATGIGIVAGLRAVTAPAAVSWAAHLGWLHLQDSHLSFMGSAIAVAIFSLGVAGEDINDKLPKTPSRTAPPSFIIRVLMGAFCGVCVCASAGKFLIAGGFLGATGAVIGTLGGYQLRTRLVKASGLFDLYVAFPVDLIALALGFLLLSVG
jgi:uncharacterized membrane protein